ncbi:uncharacterized protein LOC111275869 isoform X2 [Durio zibethinus]|nr:uncharacterized protein LOC111275869 isoform X2 [Durio zibethinus]XP_022717187.1 uncharacterized protein LOC111275869 isoform X2 [Durio zibethinus]XP_022717188.1 uncharacterized protein LOC111275869 isoform X2 [Durio zibethinus]
MKNLIGEAACSICQESFSTTITEMAGPPGSSALKKSSGFNMARFTQPVTQGKEKGKAPQFDMQPPISDTRIVEKPPQHSQTGGKNTVDMAKLKEKMVAVEKSYKRPRVESLSTDIPPEVHPAGGKYSLAVEFKVEDSAFDNPEVAKKIGQYTMIKKDFDRLPKSASKNMSQTILHSYKAFAHLIKVEQDMKKYTTQITSLLDKNKKLKDSNIEFKSTNDKLGKKVEELTQRLEDISLQKAATDFLLRQYELRLNNTLAEVESLKRDLQASKDAEPKAVENFLLSEDYYNRQTEFARSQVFGSFDLALREVKFIYKDLDLSMIDVKNLRTVKDDGGEKGEEEQQQDKDDMKIDQVVAELAITTAEVGTVTETFTEVQLEKDIQFEEAEAPTAEAQAKVGT